MNELKKYIIYSTGRSGSTLYATLLTAPWELEGYRNCISYSGGDREPDWTRPIHHTHQPAVFKNAPDDFIKIIAGRSILDTTVSTLIARATDKWHLFNNAQSEKYKATYTKKKFKLNIDDFSVVVNGSDFKYAKALAHYNKFSGEKYIVSYVNYSDDYSKWYLHLNSDPSIYTNNKDNAYFTKIPKKMPVDKFLLVDNLQEVLDVYKEIDVLNDFNDIDTINHIENILKEQK